MSYRHGVRARLEQHADEILAAYQAGASLDDLAATYECSATPLRALLRSRNITLRPNRRRRLLAPRETEVREMYSSGFSTEEIAGLLGVDRNTVSQFVRDLGMRRKVGLSKRTVHIETDRDRGLVAGLLLGEGSIVTTATGGIAVRIVNTDRDIIECLSRFGGRVHWVKPRRGCPNPLGTWDVSRAVDVLHLLTEVRPLLVGVKGDRADRALAVLRSRYGLNHGGTS